MPKTRRTNVARPTFLVPDPSWPASPTAECCHPECWAEPEPEAEMPLCRDHLFKAGADFDRIFRPPAAMNPEPSSSEPKPRDPMVYFIRFGERIKIGFTTDIDQRLRDLPYDEVLALLPGTRTDEARCHAAFKHLRITGEWFRDTPELREFISDISAGQPLCNMKVLAAAMPKRWRD